MVTVCTIIRHRAKLSESKHLPLTVEREKTANAKGRTGGGGGRWGLRHRCRGVPRAGALRQEPEVAHGRGPSGLYPAMADHRRADSSPLFWTQSTAGMGWGECQNPLKYQ